MSSEKDFDEWFEGKIGPPQKLREEWISYSRRKKDKPVEIGWSKDQIVKDVTWRMKQIIMNGCGTCKKHFTMFFNIKSEDPRFGCIKLKKEIFDDICNIILEEYKRFQLQVVFTLLTYHPDGFPRISLSFQLEQNNDVNGMFKPKPIIMDQISLID